MMTRLMRNSQLKTQRKEIHNCKCQWKQADKRQRILMLKQKKCSQQLFQGKIIKNYEIDEQNKTISAR